MDFSFDETEFCDPADWNAASYNDHPIDSIEPLFDDSPPSRTAAIVCLRILGSVDRFMAQSADPRLGWVAEKRFDRIDRMVVVGCCVPIGWITKFGFVE